MRLWLQGESKEDRAAVIAKLPDGALLVHAPPADVLVHWIQPLETIELLFYKLKDQITDDGAIWVVIPNEADRERRGTPFFDDEVKNSAIAAGLEATKVLPFGDREDGIRFAAHKKEEKKVAAKAEKKPKARAAPKKKA